MCGIVGVVGNSPVNQLIYDSLLLLQHRGQDAAGIATSHDQFFNMYKAHGLVRDVFRTRNMRSLPGNSGLGQVRYPTAGRSEEHTSELQSLMRISYAVFCLKKKIKKNQTSPYRTTHIQINY